MPVMAPDSCGSTVARVLLLGDSIRLAYQDRVAALLSTEREGDGPFDIVGPLESTGSSAQLAEQIEALWAEYEPDVVHWNAGLDDVVWFHAQGRNVIPVAEYGLNLQHIIDFLRPRVGGDIIFATTTPVLGDEQQAGEGERSNREIEEYNAAASEVMLQNDILINHLHGVIREDDEAFLDPQDGTSLTAPGADAAAKAVAHAIGTLHH